MRIVTDETTLRLPCEPVKDVREGGEIARQLQAALRSFNKNSVRKYQKSMGKNTELLRGLGLAAPQIGVHKRVCIIMLGNVPTVLMNPAIVEHSNTTIGFEESCLSLPGVKATIQRYTWVKVQCLNHPTTLVFGPTTPEDVSYASILKSVVCQHEIDHLSSILLTDHQAEVTQ